MRPLHSTTPRSRSRRVVITVLASALWLVVLGAVAAGAYLWKLDRTVDQNLTRVDGAFPEAAQRPPSATPPEGADAAPLTILLLGSDERPAGSAVTGQRSDAMMVVRVSAERDRVDVVSIPRDSWVAIPGRGNSKINAAYAYGGFPLAVQTVEQLLDTRIDHVAAIDMDGFKDMTDALGGVNVQVTQPFTDSLSGQSFDVGTHHVNGDQALAFVRERKELEQGDLDRAVNQQRFLEALMQKALSRSVLSDPMQLAAFVDATTRYVTVDADLTGSRIRDLGLEMFGLRGSDVHFSTIPVAGLGRSDDGQSIVQLDDAGVEQLATALKDDTVESYSP